MPRPEDDEQKIADASFLFRDAEETASPPERPARKTRPAEPAPIDPAAEGYDLAEKPASKGPVRRPVPPPSPDDPEIDPPASVRPKTTQLEPSPVPEPWSRMAEAGPALVRISLAFLALVVLVYFTFSVDRFLISLLTIAAGLGVVILLSYPIAVTLERPVRMTPEHAVRDFYGALSHHIPHFRRMWLLLSSTGQNAPEFGSYAAFQAYWKARIAELKRGGKGGFTPLSVRIDDFKSDKSAGQDAVEASYSLSIFLRGSEREEPLYAARVSSTFSRGPDRMWYLDDGRLPRR